MPPWRLACRGLEISPGEPGLSPHHANYVLATCLASVEWSPTAQVCQGLPLSSDALLDSMGFGLSSRGAVHALQWLFILLILAHVELTTGTTGEPLTIVEKPLSSLSHEGDRARTARSSFLSGIALRQDFATLADDMVRWNFPASQICVTTLMRMDLRAFMAPLLQDSFAGDGPFIGFPASLVYAWRASILKRRCSYIAQCVGQASHPGP